MGRNLKNFLTDLLMSEERKKSIRPGAGSVSGELETMEDEESLTEEVPYKLEPSLANGEKYLNSIRRQGF